MRGDLVGVGFPTRVDVDQGVDGEGEGLDEVVGDRLCDLVALADREVGIDRGDHRDEHAMPVPVHPDVVHGGDPGDRTSDMLSPVDQRWVHGIEESPEHSGSGMPEQHQDHPGHH